LTFDHIAVVPSFAPMGSHLLRVFDEAKTNVVPVGALVSNAFDWRFPWEFFKVGFVLKLHMRSRYTHSIVRGRPVIPGQGVRIR
jgi:hypothetical protein